jgi:hypothetical protein
MSHPTTPVAPAPTQSQPNSDVPDLGTPETKPDQPQPPEESGVL